LHKSTFWYTQSMKQKILVTGWAGFIGSNFLNIFVPQYPDIDFINIDLLTYAGDMSNIVIEVQSAQNYFFEKVDIRDIAALERIYTKYQPTDSIHFAAETHVDKSIENPCIFTETNVLGTQNLLECHRKFQLQRFHLISTDEVYGDIPDGGLFTEESLLRPSNPYSSSKASSEMLVHAYARTFWLNTVITRCSNNYWPHQDSSKLIPYFIQLLRNNQPVTLYGDGSHIRDWLFVEDHCEAIWKVFCEAHKGAIYNIWGNNERSNLEIARMLIQMLWKTEDLITFIEDRKWHDKRYALDASKLQSDLGWSPQVSFSEGISCTIQYYLNH